MKNRHSTSLADPGRTAVARIDRVGFAEKKICYHRDARGVA
jgi:hypothetical protein